MPEPVDVAQIEHRFVPTVHEDKLASLVAELGGDRGLTLVFVRTKRGADRLVKRLGREGVEAVAMHGDKSQAQREKALARFQAGKIDTLVATDVAARGIHVTGISHVINFDPPEDREGYVHRVGRTGRAGRTGVGITFVERRPGRRRRPRSPRRSTSTRSTSRPASRSSAAARARTRPAAPSAAATTRAAAATTAGSRRARSRAASNPTIGAAVTTSSAFNQSVPASVPASSVCATLIAYTARVAMWSRRHRRGPILRRA